MKLDKVFCMIAAVLASALLIQLAIAIYQKPEPRYFAAWKDRPTDMAGAKNMARQIVTGVVTKVKRADDLIVKAPGEPNNEDRIPIEVVTIKLEKAHKGEKPEMVQVFHTGATNDPGLKDRPAPPGPPPPKPAGGVDRPTQLPKPTEAQTRTVMLHDDPPYKVGDRYVLLLKDAPTVTVAGAPIKTQRVISPEGRYRITADNKVEPVIERGFAGAMKDKRVEELEAEFR